MNWTEEDISRLRNAIASGVLRVKYSDREVEYRSLREMMDLLSRMRREGKKTETPLRGSPVYSKGLR